MGYCEFSSGVGQQMATFDEGKPPQRGSPPTPVNQCTLARQRLFGRFTNRSSSRAGCDSTASMNGRAELAGLPRRTAVIEISSQAYQSNGPCQMSSGRRPRYAAGSCLLARPAESGTVVRLIAGNALAISGRAGFVRVMPERRSPIEWDARRTSRQNRRRGRADLSPETACWAIRS